MRPIRTFSIDEGVLHMETLYPDEFDDFVGTKENCRIICPVSPDAQDIEAFKMFCAPDFPLDLRIKEMQYFLNVLNQMYYA